MCGIAGIFRTGSEAEVLKKQLGTTLDAIFHRGPDDGGLFGEPGAALGMRRLSIIDLPGGHQPMATPDGRFILVFNGEIYNFKELRAELCSLGYIFRTDSDTEVLLLGYTEWRDKVVDRLNGMFAFAVYDRKARELFLARDHFGIKPIYYIHQGSFFAFCSEPAPLHLLPECSRRIDRQGFKDYLLFKYVPSPLTMAESVKKLHPGSFLRFSANGGDLTQTYYWTLLPQDVPSGAAEAEEELTRLLVEAVRRQVVADVPVGTFLSGGIDSGLLVWAMVEAGLPEAPEAYTVAFEDAAFDESPYARLTAQRFGLRHRVDTLPAPSPDELYEMVRVFGEPFANTSVPANLLVSSGARKHVKVALNGSGADELFAGYDRYYGVNPPAMLSLAAPWAGLFAPVLSRLPAGTYKRDLMTKGQRFLEGYRLDGAARHGNSVYLFKPPEIEDIAPALPAGCDIVRSYFLDAPGNDDLQRATWTDIRTMLADDYLTLVDRTSMAASLEVRVPFLDLDLAKFSFSLPSSFKMRNWSKKRLLRRVARRVLPDAVMRQPKQGFESPVGQWFRGPLARDFMDVFRSSPARDLLSEKAVNELLERHKQGAVNASRQLLAIYTFSVWAKIFHMTS